MITGFIPPQEIEITSDGTAVKFISHKPAKKGQTKDLYIYEYTSGVEKFGTTVEWDSDYITRQLGFFFKQVK